MQKSITPQQIGVLLLLLISSVTSPLFSQITIDNIMGVNARERDPIPRMKAVGFVREYHNWFFNEGYPDGSNPPNYSFGYPNAKYKWNAPYQDTSPTTLFDDFYQEIIDNELTFAPSFLGTIRQLVDPDGTLPFGEHIIDEFIPVAPGADSLNPASYLAHAAYMYHYAARYGNTTFTPNRIASFINPFTHADETVKTGLGMVNYMEDWNEQDKFWFRDFNDAQQTYFAPDVYAAMLSADYDGHMQTMGLQEDPDNLGTMVSTVGIKNADPTMKVVIGGLAVADVDYFREMVDWSKANRTDVPLEKVLPFDVLNIHKYTGDSLEYLNSTFGISPEAGRLRDTLLVFDAYRDSLETAFNVDLELWLSEFGYDTYTPAPGTRGGAAPAIGDNDNYEVQAQWLVRSYLEAFAAGVDKAIMFDLRDECTDPDNPNSACGLFSSSGLLENIHNNFKPKTSWFYTYTMKNVLAGMVYDMDLSNCSDTTCTRVYRFKDPNGGNKRVYALWQPTSSDDTTSYHFVNESLSSATLVKLEAPSTRGISETITDASPMLTVTERPIFIIVNDTYFTTQNCQPGSLSSDNPTCSSINVLVDVPENSGSYQLWSMQGSFQAHEFSQRSATLIREELFPVDSVITVPNLNSSTFYTFFLIPEGVGASESDKICMTQNTTLAATSNCYLDIQTDWIFDDFQNDNTASPGLQPYTLFDEQEYGDSICRVSTTLPESIWGFNNLVDQERSVSLDLQAYYFIDLFTIHDQYSEGNFTIQIADSPNGPWTTISEYFTTLNNEWTHLTNLTPPNTPIRYLKFIAGADNEAKVGEVLLCGRVSDFNPDILPGVAKNGTITCDNSELSWEHPFDDDIKGYKIIDDVTKIILGMVDFTSNLQTYQLPMDNQAINFAIVTIDNSDQESIDSLKISSSTLARISDCQIPLTTSMIFDHFNQEENALRLVDEQTGYDPICDPSIVPTTNFWGQDFFFVGTKEHVSLNLGGYYEIDQIIMHDGEGQNGHVDIFMASSPNGPWTNIISHDAVLNGWATFNAPIPNNTPVKYLRLEASTDNQVIVGELFICGTLNENFTPDILPGVAKDGMASAIMCNEVTLGWTAPFDDNIAQYLVYSEGNLVGMTSTTSLMLNNLSANTHYTFKIVTEDNGGNQSTDSLTIAVTTNMEGECNLVCNVTCACAICVRPSWITSLNAQSNFSKDALFDEQDIVPFCGATGLSFPQSFYSNNGTPGNGNAPDTVVIDLQKVYDISDIRIFFQGSNSGGNFILQYLNSSNVWAELINHSPSYAWNTFSNLDARTQHLRILHNDNGSQIGEMGICGTEYVNLLCPATIDLTTPISQADTFTAGIITSNTTLSTGIAVGYYAENSVTLTAGFHAVAGVDFTAKIAPCPDDVIAPSDIPVFAKTQLSTPTETSSKNTLAVYPNPFQSSTTIAFDLEQSANVHLAIFDATGRIIQTLVDHQSMDNGQHKFLFNKSNLENGFYIARLQVGQEILLQKMILLD